MCVKGVNRQIIEVVNTENETFEKAILFLRAEKQDSGEEELEREAESYLNGLAVPRLSPRRKNRKRLLIWGIGALLAIGAGVTLLLLL